MPRTSRRDDMYSTPTGIIFLFNLIVGTGALALPGAFQKSGWIMGIALLLTIAFVSFITVTFLVESLAISNAVSRKRYEGGMVENTPLVSEGENVFEITEKYELGQMSILMSPRWCQIIVYLSLCVYLFGDLAIYIVVVGKTMSSVACEVKFNYSDNAPCWSDHGLSRINFYRISVVGFILLLGPFVFFNLQKTKALQIFSACLRWLSFFVMLSWSLYKLFTTGNQGKPQLIEFTSLPTIFGSLVYSFMCHHSIPGLLLPIKNKKHIKAIIKIDFSVVATFYLLLTMTAVFAFPQISEIYTLSFWADLDEEPHMFLLVLAYFLALFPVFTLSTSFPIIGITLRNNLRALFLKNSPVIWYFDKLLFPLLTILPPLVLTLAVTDMQLLVGIVGSYAGTCVQYLIPCLLVTYARKEARTFDETNIYASPFKNKFWIIAVYIWMAISLILITINYVLTKSK